jgi:hypothetical protein
MQLLLAQCVMCFRNASAQQLERARVLNDGSCCLAFRRCAFWPDLRISYTGVADMLSCLEGLDEA